MPLFNKANLIQCFHGLRRDGAAGIDKLSKQDYGKNLEANIDDLIARMKKFQYRPLPVKEVLIPKSNGGVRPLGISVVEDKIVQSMFEKVLTAIFEPTFKDCSFGFRPGRNCHMAIKEVHKYLYDAKTPVVIDVDLANYFGSIDHKLLLEFVSERIEDASFLRYLVRMLRCGIQVGGVVKPTRVGTPQGAICSPVLANIFAHHVMDKWIEDMVAPLFPGTRLVRYADDCIICCPSQRIADSIMAVLDQRLAKFGLSLNAKKTKVVAMNKSLKWTRRDRSGQNFNFLGFTFFMAKSRSGKYINPVVMTSKDGFRRKLDEIKTFIKRSRSRLMKIVWVELNTKLRGYIQYFGVSGNADKVALFVRLSHQLFFKWFNRRSHRRSFTWEGFKLFMQSFPPPKARICFNLYNTSS